MRENLVAETVLRGKKEEILEQMVWVCRRNRLSFFNI